MARWLGLFVLVLAGEAQAQRVQPDKLREAVCIPRPPFNFRHGGNVNSTEKDPPVAEVEKRLRGDESDAEVYLLLARLYNQETEKDKVRAAYQKVISLVEKGLKEPGAGWRLALCGRALLELERVDDGFAYCSRAVEVSPKDPRTWREMIHAHAKRCYLALGLGTGKGSIMFNIDDVKQKVEIEGITQAQILAAQKHIQNIWPCYAKLAELSPRTEEAILERIGFVMEGKLVEKTLEAALGKLRWEEASQALFSPLFLEELLALAELRGKDLNTYAMALNVQLLLLQVENLEAKKDELSKTQKDKLLRILGRVSPLVDDPDRELAWNSAMMVGVFVEQFVDRSAGELFFRKAFKLRPEKSDGAENLAACLMHQGKDKEALAVLEEQWGRTPNLRLGLMLAHALGEQKQPARAEAIVHELCKTHAAAPACRLAQAALALAKSADRKHLIEARQHLEAAQQQLFAAPVGAEEQDKSGPPTVKTKSVEFNVDDRQHWQTGYQFLNAIYLGLTDQALQSYVELRTLHQQHTNNRWIGLALSAFQD